jgi:hypothetical protein
VNKRSEILAECVDALLAGRDPYSVLDRFPEDAPQLTRLVETARQVRTSTFAGGAPSLLAPADLTLQLPSQENGKDGLASTVAGVLMLVLTLGILFVFKDAAPTTAEASLILGWLTWWLARSPSRGRVGGSGPDHAAWRTLIVSPTRTS